MNELRPPVICLVTDRTRYVPGSLVPTIAAAARAGVDLIQVRERNLADRELLALVREVTSAVAGTGARVIVNDRLDIALAAGAAGVHLPGHAVSSADVRRIAPAGFLVGRSVHAASEAAAATAGGGYDYLVFGSILPSASKPRGQVSAGFDGLAAACRAVDAAASAGGGRVPVLAIGGLTAADAPAVARAGAEGLAAIGLFAGARDVAGLVTALRSAFDS
jgi:thiamine-phosphate pyrophosphorylase